VKNAYLNNSKKVIYTPNNIKFDFTKNIKYNAEFNRKEHEMALKDILHIKLNLQTDIANMKSSNCFPCNLEANHFARLFNYLNLMERKLISSFLDGIQIYFKLQANIEH